MMCHVMSRETGERVNSIDWRPRCWRRRWRGIGGTAGWDNGCEDGLSEGGLLGTNEASISLFSLGFGGICAISPSLFTVDVDLLLMSLTPISSSH